MSHAYNKVRWCLNKAKKELEESDLHRGLVKTEESTELAEKHISKAEHNMSAAIKFDETGFSDWSASAFFYTIYHCFLAILRKFGYESRNQECTLAAIEMLNEEGKTVIEEKFIDALKASKAEEMHESSIIKTREDFQYGIELEFSEREEFSRMLEMCKDIIDKTKGIVHK